MSILTTTYEGTHNHPLPYSATAMASTTSAAASMLMSGSTSSQSGSSPLSATSADLHGLNYYLSDSSKSNQFYLPNSSLSTVSSNPTITLDLTASSSSSSSSYFNRLSSNHPPPRLPCTSFSFNSSESNSLPNSWGNGLLSYGGSTTQPYSRNYAGSLNPGRYSQENLFHPHLQKNNPAPVQQLLADPIAAATKAITSDPSFQSALATALASIMGANGGIQANHGGREAFGQKPKWGNEPLAAHQSTSKGNGCATSYLNKSPSANSQPGSLMFLPPALPFSTPKNASASPAENREHTS